MFILFVAVISKPYLALVLMAPLHSADQIGLLSKCGDTWIQACIIGDPLIVVVRNKINGCVVPLVAVTPVLLYMHESEVKRCRDVIIIERGRILC